MAIYTNDYKQVVKAISYQGTEANKVLHMEQVLMDKYGYNRSQLHKQLVREKYQQVVAI
jgi:hypothetical protein|tara:strand:+ start:713 stop:889 length:177 start_codon:yes stop_codon:yes gene_type:complete